MRAGTAARQRSTSDADGDGRRGRAVTWCPCRRIGSAIHHLPSSGLRHATPWSMGLSLWSGRHGWRGPLHRVRCRCDSCHALGDEMLTGRSGIPSQTGSCVTVPPSADGQDRRLLRGADAHARRDLAGERAQHLRRRARLALRDRGHAGVAALAHLDVERDAAEDTRARGARRSLARRPGRRSRSPRRSAGRRTRSCSRRRP